MHIVQNYHVKLPVSLYGGMERVVEALCEGYLEMGHRVSLISYRGDYEIPGVNHIYLDGLSIEQSYEKLPQLIPGDADIIHFHLPFDLKKLGVKIPAVFTMHGNLRPEENPASLPTNMVFLCQNHAQRHGRTSFVFNGLNPSKIQFDPIPLIQRSAFAFLGKASLKRKGLHLAKQLAKHFRTPLLVGGKRGFSFSRGVKYLGYLNNREKFQMLNQCRGLLFPILWEEPFGLVMIESMFVGTPVFGLNRGSVPEVLGQAGGQELFIGCNSVEELQSRMNNYSFQADPTLIREYAVRNFSHLTMCEQYLKYYTRIISGQALS